MAPIKVSDLFYDREEREELEKIGLDIKETLEEIIFLSEDEKRQDRRDLKELQEKTEKMAFNLNATISTYREAATEIDKVQTDCKTAHVSGTGASIFGAFLAIATTMMTGWVAGPLLMAGLSCTVAGVTTNIGAVVAESRLSSTVIKMAEKQLSETSDSIMEANSIVQDLLKKDNSRIVYMYYLAKTRDLSGVVLGILRELVFKNSKKETQTVENAKMPCAQVLIAVEKEAVQSFVDVVQQQTDQAGTPAPFDADVEACIGGSTKSGSKIDVDKEALEFAAGLVLEAVHPGFTIVKDNESEAAKILRKKADELENALNQYQNIS